MLKYFDEANEQATLDYITKIPNEYHIIKIQEIELAVFPNVFSPKYFFDPEYFALNVAIKKDEDFLDVGCGSGIMSVFAAKRGANVTASDINPWCLLNTAYNALYQDLRIKVVESDVFENITGSFDTIFSNPPWACVKEKDLNWILKSLWDPEYEMNKKLITQSKYYLKDDGRLLIGFSSTIGDIEYISDVLYKNGYNHRIISSKKSRAINFDATFELIEAKQR